MTELERYWAAVMDRVRQYDADREARRNDFAEALDRAFETGEPIRILVQFRDGERREVSDE